MIINSELKKYIKQTITIRRIEWKITAFYQVRTEKYGIFLIVN